MNSTQHKLKQIQQQYTELCNILQHQENLPIVAVWGLLNAGKSSLLNMLTEHFNEECFKTNDFRETSEIKTHQFGQVIYLDTPGLDADNNDDLEAERGIARADIVLFVHQPQGELEKIELDFLRNLKRSFYDHAEQNIILVISKADKESTDKIQEIENKILAQCRNELGFTPKCFQISNTRFHKGINEHKNNLTKASRVGELSAHVQKLANDSVGINQKRCLMRLAELANEAGSLINEISNNQQALIQNLANEFTEFNQVVDDLRDYIDDARKRYQNI